jgi:Family of unknown function (DUF6010)
MALFQLISPSGQNDLYKSSLPSDYAIDSYCKQIEYSLGVLAPLLVTDYVGPAVGAVIFVLVMSLVKEPARRTFNKIIAAGASGVYLSSVFGPWEWLYFAIVTPVVYLGLQSYRFVALAGDPWRGRLPEPEVVVVPTERAVASRR